MQYLDTDDSSYARGAEPRLASRDGHKRFTRDTDLALREANSPAPPAFLALVADIAILL